MTLKKKIYLSIIIFGLISALSVVFLLHPLFLEIKKASQEIISQKQALVFLEAKIKNLEDFKKIYPTISPNLAKVNDLFINPELPIGFIGFLEESAQQTKLAIEISPLPVREVEKTTWPFLTFQIKTPAPFPKFLRFLEKIENSPYLIEIQSLTAAKALEEPEVKAVITLKVFTR